MKYVPVGYSCKCAHCDRYGLALNFAAYCAKCWSKLDEQQRAAIKGEPIPVPIAIYKTRWSWKRDLFWTLFGVANALIGVFVIYPKLKGWWN